MNWHKDLRMKRNKYISIAVTGGIGSGKSLACQFFKNYGIPCVSADILGHEVLQNQRVIDKLIAIFGSEIVIENQIDRSKLGNIAFNMENGDKILNSILHPLIVEKIKKNIKDQKSITAYEIPLLFEAGLQNLFDVCLLVTADKHVRMKRILQRKGMTTEKAENILNSQMPETEKAKLADHVIENNSTEQDLKNKLTDFLNSNINTIRS